MHVNGTLPANVIKAPYDIHEIIARNNHAWTLNQIQQHFEFLRTAAESYLRSE